MSAANRDERDDYVDALMGMPPEGFNEKIVRALTLCSDQAVEDSVGELDEDVLLIAAAAHRQTTNSNLVGLVQRVKQVAKWLTRDPLAPPAEQGSRQLLENKTEELARQVANGCFLDEGFVLLVFQHGTPDNFGYLAHASSVSRNEQIKLLEFHLARMKAGQEGKS